MSAIQKKFIGNDQVDGDKTLLLNDQALRSKNNVGTPINLVKLDATNQFSLLTGLAPAVAPSPVDGIPLGQAQLPFAKVETMQSKFRKDAISVTGDTDGTTAVITNISDTSLLEQGMDFYGPGIPQYSQIQSVDSPTQITLNQNTISAGVGSTLYAQYQMSMNTGDNSGSAPSATLDIHAGNAENIFGGRINIHAGVTTGSGKGGDLNINSGHANGSGDSGHLQLSSGNANTGSSNNVDILSGNAGANSGSIILQTGSAGGSRGDVLLDANQVDVNNTKIVNVANGVNPNDAVNVSQLSAFTPKTDAKETFTLTSTDITNKYVDLDQEIFADSLDFLISGAGDQLEGIDYSTSLVGLITRVSWAGLGLDGVLEAGDVIQLPYSY
jgi:hypothetical protein